VFDWISKSVEFSTQPAHSETIFDCRFKPSNPNTLATASYDSTIKVFYTDPHAPTHICTHARATDLGYSATAVHHGFEGAARRSLCAFMVPGCVTCQCSTLPGVMFLQDCVMKIGGEDENRLVCGSSTGEVYVWDAKKGQVYWLPCEPLISSPFPSNDVRLGCQQVESSRETNFSHRLESLRRKYPVFYFQRWPRVRYFLSRVRVHFVCVWLPVKGCFQS
jgi:hypothetical protein